MNFTPITLDGESVERKRAEVLEYFLHTYSLYEKIFTLLKDDSVFYKKSEPTRHPMIFYFGHTATFFINKLILAKVITDRINPKFESMFAVGVDEMSWDDMDESNYKWADVDDVRSYRDKVKELVSNLIKTLPLTLPITQDSPWWVILMGIEHERIHIETSSVLHRQMPLEFINKVADFKVCQKDRAVPKNEFVSIPSYDLRLGKDLNHHLYGWDNEYGKKEVHVPSFEVSKYLVSNGEFMEFVQNGGYENESYWDDEGKKFLQIKKPKHPPFWIKNEDKSYSLRVLDQIIPMPLSWAVEVSALEAMAFCRYKGEEFGLITEEQWYAMYEDANIQDIPELDINRANINFTHYASPSPVDEFAFGKLYDIIGNVWQWTSTPIYGFEGFKEHPIYDDFSTPTFDGKHNIMKGGSFASSGNALMKHSRYAFRRHFYQHAGFRYVKLDKNHSRSQDENIYELDTLVNQYCDFQYGDEYFGVKNFALTMAEYANFYTKDRPQKRVLEVGCATGRCSFELTNIFDEVTGIDFSARFIQVAVKLQESKVIRYERKTEGDLRKKITKNIDDFSFSKTKNNVKFWQGDACNLKEHFKDYDLILATNLIDRLYNPKLFLDDLHNRLNDEGILILTSPYTWQEESTKKEFWLGGYTDNEGLDHNTLDGLKEILSKNFELIDTKDVPFVIRESDRKYQHTISQMSVWKKRLDV